MSTKNLKYKIYQETKNGTGMAKDNKKNKKTKIYNFSEDGKVLAM